MSKKTVSWPVLPFLSASFIAFAVPIHASADTMSWRMTTPWSGGPLLERDAQGFADWVEKLTDGRITIEVFPGGTVGSPLRVTNSVRSGVAQVGHNYINYDYGSGAATSVLAGHSSGMTPEEFMLWMYEGGGAELYEEYRQDKFGVVGLPCSIVGTEIFLHSNKRIETLEDFQGVRLRTSGAWAEIASRLGASTIVMAGGDIYSALERGVIDAAEWANPEQNIPTGFHEVAQYVVVPGIHQSGGVNECLINNDTWNSLSEGDQDTLRLAAKLNMFDTYLDSTYNDIDAFQQYIDGPNEIVRLDQTFIDAVMEETKLWEDENAAKDEWFSRIIESQREFKEKMKLWPQYRMPIGEVGR